MKAVIQRGIQQGAEANDRLRQERSSILLKANEETRSCICTILRQGAYKTINQRIETSINQRGIQQYNKFPNNNMYPALSTIVSSRRVRLYDRKSHRNVKSIQNNKYYVGRFLRSCRDGVIHEVVVESGDDACSLTEWVVKIRPTSLDSSTLHRESTLLKNLLAQGCLNVCPRLPLLQETSKQLQSLIETKHGKKN